MENNYVIPDWRATKVAAEILREMESCPRGCLKITEWQLNRRLGRTCGYYFGKALLSRGIKSGHEWFANKAQAMLDKLIFNTGDWEQVEALLRKYGLVTGHLYEAEPGTDSGPYQGVLVAVDMKSLNARYDEMHATNPQMRMIHNLVWKVFPN